MKTTDLRGIMSMAWRFFRITGQTFADCLRQAWVNFKLVAAMRARIVRFYFRKVDGAIREAWGTLRSDLIPPTVGDDRKRNDTVQAYFDTERGEYRCFKRLNLVAIN
jgi:hypothetical protein